MVIAHWVVINNTAVVRDGKPLACFSTDQQELTTFEKPSTLSPDELYHIIGCNYPKFFKMDKLCKWAFIAAEVLLDGGGVYGNVDKNKIGIALSTGHGCLDVDKRYFETIDLPSPALFVYTLPNIMLGELCIRHGFKGEQICMVSEQFDTVEIHFAASNFLINKNMDACLSGWIDVSDRSHDIALFWITKRDLDDAIPFTPKGMQELLRGAEH